MATVYIARDTTLGDSFETNYSDSTGFTALWTRQMTTATASEVESTATMPNLADRILIYHVEVGLLSWGTGDYITRLRVGATGDTLVELDQVFCRRVSSDGNTIRASISTSAALNQTLAADTDRDNTISDSGGTLDEPTGAASTDHLVLVFHLNNTSSHGGDETPTIEQNLSTSTRVSAPFTFASTRRVFNIS